MLFSKKRQDFSLKFESINLFLSNLKENRWNSNGFLINQYALIHQKNIKFVFPYIYVGCTKKYIEYAY